MIGEKLLKLTIFLLLEKIQSSFIRVYRREDEGKVWF